MDTRNDETVKYVGSKILKRVGKYSEFEKKSHDENRGKLLFGKTAGKAY